MHAFVDESQRNGLYLIGAALVAPASVNQVRGQVKGLLQAGERRLHFVKEHPSRRRAILAALTEMNLRVRIYSCGGPPPAARAACVAQLVEDLALVAGTRLVIESREGRDHQDRHTIAAAIATGRGSVGLGYEHMQPHEEPLLWPPDAVAWAYGAGGDWRRRIDGLLEKVTALS